MQQQTLNRQDIGTGDLGQLENQLVRCAATLTQVRSNIFQLSRQSSTICNNGKIKCWNRNPLPSQKNTYLRENNYIQEICI